MAQIQQLPPHRPREAVSGESFPYLCRHYRLKVQEGHDVGVCLSCRILRPTVRPQEQGVQRRARIRHYLERWYRGRALERLQYKADRYARQMGVTALRRERAGPPLSLGLLRQTGKNGIQLAHHQGTVPRGGLRGDPGAGPSGACKSLQGVLAPGGTPLSRLCHPLHLAEGPVPAAAVNSLARQAALKSLQADEEL